MRRQRAGSWWILIKTRRVRPRPHASLRPLARALTVHLKVLPAQTLRNANAAPLVLLENPQQTRVVWHKVAVFGADAKRGNRVSKARADVEGHVRHAYLFGMSLSIGLGRITCRYSYLSSESAGRRGHVMCAVQVRRIRGRMRRCAGCVGRGGRGAVGTWRQGAQGGQDERVERNGARVRRPGQRKSSWVGEGRDGCVWGREWATPTSALATAAATGVSPASTRCACVLKSSTARSLEKREAKQEARDGSKRRAPRSAQRKAHPALSKQRTHIFPSK